MRIRRKSKRGVARRALGPRIPSARALPWLWSAYLIRSRIPLPIAGAFVAAAFLGSGWAIAADTGASAHYLADPRWYASALALGAVSCLLGYLPGALDRLWESLHPWLATPEQEAAAFWAQAPVILMRYFWPAWAFWLLVIGPSAFNPGASPWLKDYPSPDAFRPLLIGVTIFGTYFLAAATSPAVAGLTVFSSQMSKHLVFKRGLASNASNIFAPFTRLANGVWLAYTIPVALVIASEFVVAGPQAALLSPRLVLTAAAALVMTLLTVFLPHRNINRLIASERAKEMSSQRMDVTGRRPFHRKRTQAKGKGRGLP